MNEDIAYCGMDCSACRLRESVLCKGCRAYDNPDNADGESTYWGGICEIKECATKLQKVEHCGLCEKFPCDLLLDISFDPETGDEGLRIERLKELSDEKITLWGKIRPSAIGTLLGIIIGIIIGAIVSHSFDWFAALAGGDYTAIPNTPGSFVGYAAAFGIIGAAIPLIVNNRKEK
jgi:hypothetical protein